VYEAAVAATRQSLQLFEQAVDGLADEALDWRPLPAMNSLAVLLAHCDASLRFWLRAAAAEPVSMRDYEEGERAASFRASGGSVSSARARLEQLAAEAEEILAGAPATALSAARSWPGGAGPQLTGAECLFRALGHLREHVGQAQLMRELWLAAQDSPAPDASR
jgi:hypothetical protein